MGQHWAISKDYSKICQKIDIYLIELARDFENVVLNVYLEADHSIIETRTFDNFEMAMFEATKIAQELRGKNGN